MSVADLRQLVEKSTQQTYDRYIKALMDIGQAITSDLFLEDLFKLIVMVTARVTGVEICSLWLVDENDNPPVIRLRATQAIYLIQGKSTDTS